MIESIRLLYQYLDGYLSYRFRWEEDDVRWEELGFITYSQERQETKQMLVGNGIDDPTICDNGMCWRFCNGCIYNLGLCWLIQCVRRLVHTGTSQILNFNNYSASYYKAIGLVTGKKTKTFEKKNKYVCVQLICGSYICTKTLQVPSEKREAHTRLHAQDPRDHEPFCSVFLFVWVFILLLKFIKPWVRQLG